MVVVEYCPVCGDKLSTPQKSDKGIITCSSCGDIYVDANP